MLMPAEVGFKEITGLLQLVICLAEHKADQVARRIWTLIKRTDRQHCDSCLCRHALTEGNIVLLLLMGLQQLPARSQQAPMSTATNVFKVRQSLDIRVWLP